MTFARHAWLLLVRWIARSRSSRPAIRLGTMSLLFLAVGCGGTPPDALGVTGSRLAPCPPTSNCVCSDDEGPRFGAPFRLATEPDEAWRSLERALTGAASVRLITRDPDYLHAEATSLVFRFVDDVEFHLRHADSLIAVRSASRRGSYDFGVNRRRIERLRDELRAAGAIR